MKERRRHPRSPARGWLRFRVGDRIVRAPLVDVSLSGVRAACAEQLWRGTYLEVNLELAHARALALAALVLDDTSERGDLALSFLSAGETSTEALASAIGAAAAEHAAATRSGRTPTASAASVDRPTSEGRRFDGRLR